jgi:hypothetical protein
MAPAMGMSEPSIEEYTGKMRARYARLTGRKARGKLLDEFVEVTGWERKHANKVLLNTRRRTGRRGKRGAPRRYGGEVGAALKTCWLAMEQPCGKRMKDMLPLWAEHLDCPDEIRVQVAEISAASIDRLLRDFKVTAAKKVRPPPPAVLPHIPPPHRRIMARDMLLQPLIPCRFFMKPRLPQRGAGDIVRPVPAGCANAPHPVSH